MQDYRTPLKPEPKPLTGELPGTAFPRRQMPEVQPPGPPPKQEFFGATIDQVNHAVERVSANHMQLFGTKPQPGLIFDIVRGVGQKLVDDVDHLFNVPTSKSAALVRKTPIPVVEPITNQLAGVPPETIKRLHSMNLDPAKLVTMKPDEREKYVYDAMRKTIADKQKPIIAQQLGAGSEFIVFGRAVSQISHAIKDIPYGIKNLVVAGGRDVYDIVRWPAYLAEKPFNVLAEKAGVPEPFARPGVPSRTGKLFVGVGKSIAEDVMHPRERIGYLLLDVFGAFTLGSTAVARGASALGRAGEVGTALRAESVVARGAITDPEAAAAALERRAVEMEKNPPKERPLLATDYAKTHKADIKDLRESAQKVRETGDLSVVPGWARDNVLGHLSVRDTVNIAARQAGTFAREAVRRPYHPPAKIGFGAYQAYVPVFDNYLIRKLQTGIIERMNVNMMKRHAPEAEMSVARNSRMYDFFLSPERWTKRFMDNQMALDVAIETFPAHELARLTTWKARAEAMSDAIVHDRDMNAAWKALKPIDKLALGKLITAVFTEDPNPVAVWRNFHGRQIEDALDQMDVINEMEGKTPREVRAMMKKQNRVLKNHQAHLDALDGAVSMMENPPPHLQQIIDHAYDVSERQERIKMEPLGYDPLVLSSHGSEVASIGRGEKIALDEEGRPMGIVVPGSIEDSLLRKGSRVALNELNREKRKLKTLEAKLVAPSKKAGVVADRPGIRAKIEEQRLAVDAATDKLLVARHHETLLGSRAIPMDIYKREGGPQRPFYLRRAYEGDDVGFFPVLIDKKTGEFHIGEIGEEHWDMMDRLNPGPGHAHWQYGYGPWHQGGGMVRNGKVVHVHLDDARDVEMNYAANVKMSDKEKEIAAQAQKELGIELLRQGREGGYISTRVRSGEVEVGRANKMMARISRGKYGRAAPRVTITRMTGTALQLGDNIIDMSDLLVHELTTAVKASVQMDQWNKIWESAMSTEDFNRYFPDPAEGEGTYLQPVRDIRSVPAHLKKYVNILLTQKVDKKLAAELDEKGMQALREWLYPKKDEILKEGDPHVKWMDERFFMDTVDKAFWMKADRLMSNAFAPLNEPFRFLLIFGTPAYLLNAVGAAATLATKQGFLAIPNLGRSYGASKIWGGEVARFLDVGAGSTHAMAYVTEKNIFTQGSQKIAAAWQRATDLYFRRAAVIGRLREAGLLRDDLTGPELIEHLSSAENRVAVRHAFQLGRQDMLDFDKMTWPERATLRHLVFVYAFMRAGSIYSVRWLLEHPVQADVLTHAGEDRIKEIERLVGKTPSWFLNENYFPIGHDSVLNGVQLNIPDTLNQISYPIASLFSDVPYQTPLDLLGSAASFWQQALTGTESGGKAVPERYSGPGQPLVNSFLDLFAQTPPGHFLRKSKHDIPLPPAPTQSGTYDPISSAHSQESAALSQPTFDTDTLWNGWGEVILRSSLPRHPNQAGMAARYWRDLKQNDLDGWKQHQLDLVHQMVERQGKALGISAPKEVMDAVDIVANREVYIAEQTKKWQDAHQQSLEKGVGDRQLAVWTIDFLKKEALIDDKTAKRYRTALSQVKDTRDAKRVWMGALRQNGTKPWEQWVQKADAVDWFNHEGYAEVLGSLKERKLGDYSSSADAPENVKWVYGRQYVNYLDRLHQFTEQQARAKRYTERALIAYDMKDFIERNDKPVKVGGHTFPSPVRVAFTRLSPPAQEEKIRAAAVSGWTGLDGFTKELLTGQKTDPNVVYGYRNLASWLDAYKRDNPGKRPPLWLKEGYIKSLEKRLPAFKTDYEFSRQTVAYRLQRFKPFTNSTHSTQWKQLLDLADQRARSLKKSGYTQEGISDQWKVYDLPEVQKWIDNLPVGFKRELSRWSEAHPQFLANLVK